MTEIIKQIELGGRKLTLSTGKLAKQATASVVASYGETVVLATVVAAPLKFDPGYFPLTVDYQERLYAGGRIKGSRWVKREGRPSDDEILSGRLIDRSVRPLFPKEYKKDVQVIVTVLSVDHENDPSVLSAIATSAALSISPIPWKGPIATLRIGMKDGSYFTNPIDSEQTFSDMDLVVSLTKDSVVMVEAGAKEVSEESILGGIEYARSDAEKIMKLINEIAFEIGNKKEGVGKENPKPELIRQVRKLVDKKLPQLISSMINLEGGKGTEYEDLAAAVNDQVQESEKHFVSEILDNLQKEYIRSMILSGKRPDGRKLTEIRPLFCQVSILPRTHGSAIFQRGQTQVLTVTTLGSPSMEQVIESAVGEESKRYIHHYAMPPFATGEVGRMGSPNRREIGHGALAERALEPVIPSEEKFPYTVRVVSEVMASNGSTSMASVCGSTLSLMDAGVPLVSPVSGIAMGLIIDSEKKYAVLSDIMGVEDFNGDMDFKVAGTGKGITALQLDVKTLNLTTTILKDALNQAKEGRAKILKTMLETLSSPREKVSTLAPKIKVVKVPVEKIGEVIGPGGRTIKKIISETGAQIEVEDDGSVNISGVTEESVAAAVTRVEALTKEVAAGEIYDGVVKRIQPFGAFVEVLPGKEGLVHVSDMSQDFVKDPNDVVKIDDSVKVRVKEIDDLGRINLSMLLDASQDKPRQRRPVNDRGGRSFGRSGFSDRRRFRERGFSGPHFPASRLVGDKKDFGR
ncbi:polyribonucleotide nucleotidyltransferase [Candidatus Woesebacteria bacterium RIFCSPHIGHO2_01_FULL_39_28]|uniref:Polyribonucleotide nucleotidyltransferase n=1 Tax=Candidatus Woesebacteria bacterium RIFCSPHIGHO2_01_FULL_39_28 TaxID=1802496 RepID=A0A1F7YHS0_9BACT|nr:MAG: polyribonucleotide nucleotidyltransferase [Candidatus Woesebacteria bacterium RIFCSPHIGHO2_01_FULL_39_28]OGM58226.1 MAG: polyribonucleotide nucleotidyltransferase [Candidatus Woesebacteria bacterium RIFCSPLOWO2_01_FULL_38_20]